MNLKYININSASVKVLAVCVEYDVNSIKNKKFSFSIKDFVANNNRGDSFYGYINNDNYDFFTCNYQLAFCYKSKNKIYFTAIQIKLDLTNCTDYCTYNIKEIKEKSNKTSLLNDYTSKIKCSEPVSSISSFIHSGIA